MKRKTFITLLGYAPLGLAAARTPSISLGPSFNNQEAELLQAAEKQLLDERLLGRINRQHLYQYLFNPKKITRQSSSDRLRFLNVNDEVVLITKEGEEVRISIKRA